MRLIGDAWTGLATDAHIQYFRPLNGRSFPRRLYRGVLSNGRSFRLCRGVLSCVPRIDVRFFHDAIVVCSAVRSCSFHWTFSKLKFPPPSFRLIWPKFSS